MSLLEAAGVLAPLLTRWRRAFHEQPELGNELPRTQARVIAALRDIGVDDIRVGQAQTSVIATIQGAHPGPTTLLRADMDALPVQEPDASPFCSKNAGVMHACGHDAHMAMLLGAAALLHERRDELRGSVVLAFQPGEEGHGGAQLLVREGALDGVTRAFALHVAPPLPVGFCGGRAGAMMASSDTFTIELTGQGGHGSSGGGANSPLSMAARLVEPLESLGRVDSEEAFVVSVGAFHSGTSPNVLPASAALQGTLRAFSEQRRAGAIDEIESLLHSQFARSAVRASLHWHDAAAPVTVNDDEVFRLARENAERLLGRQAFLQLQSPVAASEDFGVIASHVPSALLFLGSRDPQRDCGEVHSPSLVIDEKCLPIGAALHASIALAEGGEPA